MSTQTTRPTEVEAMPNDGASAGSQISAPTNDPATSTLVALGRDQTSPQAIDVAATKALSLAGSKTGRDQAIAGAHTTNVSATNFPGDQNDTDRQLLCVAGDQDQPTAIWATNPNALSPSAVDSPSAATVGTLPKVRPPQVGDPFLALAADVVDDLEKARTANENRLRQLTRSDVDSDGEERGFGLTAEYPDVARLAAMVAAMLCDSQVALDLGIEKRRKSLGCCLEHDAVKNLERLMRSNPLGPWVKAQKGVGDKQAARLLAAIGDPYIRPELVRKDGTVEQSRPRTVSELWAYCGLHVLPASHGAADTHRSSAGGNQTGSHSDHRPADAQTTHVGVAPKRQKGQRANWSTVAKTRAYLAAEAVVKAAVRKTPEVDDSKGYDFAHRTATTSFGRLYLNTRAKYADAIHKVPCARCGPSGKPAPPGSPLSDGHKHARAMRAVSKEILKELWRESQRIHEGGA